MPDYIPYEEVDSGIIVKAFLTAVIGGLIAVGVWAYFEGIDVWMKVKWEDL